jgi:enediyne polyketide synthase
MSDGRGDGIAIVGIGCRYPGARTPQELWENVLAGRREFRRLPPERLRLDDYLGPDDDPDGIYSSQGALLEGWQFDRVRFQVSGSLFRAADPAHWLALEVADQALADAGFPAAAGLPRDGTGVLLGNTLTGEVSRANLVRLRWPYVRRVVAARLDRDGWETQRIDDFLAELEPEFKAPFPAPTEETLAGGLSNTIAGRICNHFDLHGGGYTVDGACASSLLAVVRACSALQSGELDAAIAGGVDLSLDPFELVGFARTGALARDEMRVYDARSAGFFPGEGCGVVVLLRERDAVERGCQVYAVVRGWGISSDGHGGISRPEAAGQRLALRRAYEHAGFGIDSVGYFEGHGTGTAVGDATELQALVGAVREGRAIRAAPERGDGEERTAAAGSAAAIEVGALAPAALGSIKANLGHTKAAAGVAGLIKASLVVHHQIVPPHVGGDEPHPVLLGAPDALRVLAQGEAWPAERPLRAAVSAMGFGGINAHVVVEGRPTARRSTLGPRERALVGSAQDVELFLLAADDRDELAKQAARLSELAPRLSRSELVDLAAALRSRLRPGRLRAAIVAGSPRELGERLARLREALDEHAAAASGTRRHAGATESPSARDADRGADAMWLAAAGVYLGSGQPARRLGFLFTGQGSPPPLHGGALARRFRAVAERYESGALPAGGDAVDTAVAQPAIVLHSLAGAALLARLGIEAEVAVGHSLGEISALCWAGALDEAAALALASARGRAMAGLDGSRPGAMASIAAPVEWVEELLAAAAMAAPQVSAPPASAVVAAINAPDRTVIAGEVGAVEAAMAAARRRGLAAVRLQVSHGFHSPLMAPAAAALAEALDATAMRPLGRRVASTVTGELLPAEADLRALLLRQLTAPVRFTAALAAARDLVDCWIEVGPGRVLAALAGESLAERAGPPLALDAGGASLAGLLHVVAQAFALGVPVDTGALFAGRFARPFDPERPLRFIANPCEGAGGASIQGNERSFPSSREAQRRSDLDAGEVEIAAAASRPRDDGNGSAAAHRGNDVGPAAAATKAARSAAAAADEPPLDLLRRLVAQRAELPLAAVREESRLLADLHLNSIAVGQLMAAAAKLLGVPPPASPTDFARATVGAAAQALEEARALRPAGEATATAGPPPGVDGWVRPFVVALAERPLRAPRAAAPAQRGGWRLVGPADHPLRASLAAALADVGGTGVALCLPAGAAEPPVELFLAAAREALAATADAAGAKPVRLLVVQQDGGGAAFARTLHLEQPAVATVVVDLPFGASGAVAWAAAEARAARGHVEACYDADGRRRVPRWRQLDSGGGSGLQHGAALASTDVLLATGGGKGITAECALALARDGGAALALLGRSSPSGDAELAANLERLRAAGLRVAYAAADVADAGAVRAAVAALEAELGPVTAVLHGAGHNAPRLLDALDADGFRRTLAPKLDGLRHVLAAIDAAGLRLLVAFGSIIARIGLPGECEYAVANEWLAREVARFAAAHPRCRCLTIDWSVWSGVGMGERLGAVEGLLRQGITPIPPEAGVAALRALLARPLSAGAVVVTGRFGEPPTVELDRGELPLLRFLERPRLHVPGVELVVDAEVSAETDPHLADHVFRGEPLFAAVLGLEAMAQAALALTGSVEPPTFERVEWLRPVVVPAGGATTLRVAALVREPGLVEVVVRDAATAFASDHFRALCRVGPPTAALVAETATGAIVAAPALADDDVAADGASALATVLLEPGRDLYGPLLFHRGRFQRLAGYRRLSASECFADLAVDGDATWFQPALPGELLLGDPAARDAAIHGIQACIPHALLLPVGAARISCGRLPAGEPLSFRARERRRDGAELVYDLEILDRHGAVRERWQGLRLRAVDRPPAPSSWNAALLAPYLERRLADLLPGSALRVALAAAPANRDGGGGDTGGSSRGLVARLLGEEAVLRHRPDGKPEALPGWQVSLSHAGRLHLGVAAPHPVGCDLEPVVERPPEVWQELLGEERFRLAEAIAADRGEPRDAAATRVWTAAESLVKAGRPPGAPLVVEPLPADDAASADGWVLLRSGGLRIGSLVAPVRDLEGLAALAVLAES